MIFSFVMGRNIEKYAITKFGTLEDFALTMGYSKFDICKLVDGRLSLSPKAITEVAKTLEVSVNDLMNDESSTLECMKAFSQNENQIKILGIIDTYINLKEAIRA